MPTLILCACLLMALGTCRSLLWFLAAAGALLVWLHFSNRHAQITQGADCRTQRLLRLGTGTILSLACYAALASVVLLIVRVALGWLELPTIPFEQTGLAPYLKRTPLGFYDKSELRLALLELLLLTVTFAMVFVKLSSYTVQRRGKALVLHPMGAAFAFVAYFASIYLPPYRIDLEYWVASIAAAADIRNGVWPSASGFDPSLGPLKPVLLAAWLSSFGLSALSLHSMTMVGNLIAGMATFALIRSLTGSRAAALLGASYALLGEIGGHAASNTFATPAQMALASLLLYTSLRDRVGRLWPAFLFGLTVPWDLPFGVFAALGLFLALCHQMVHATGILRTARVRAVFAALAGIGLTVVIVWAVGGARGLIQLGNDAAMTLADALLLLRHELAAPRFNASQLSLWFSGLLFLALVVRRLKRSRSLTARYLFAGASLLSAIPCALFAPVQSDTSPGVPVYWVLIPTLALIVYGAVRLLAMKLHSRRFRRIRAASPIALTAIALCVLFDILFPIDRLNQVVAKYTTGYETERQKWYTECAFGLACDPGAKPSLMNNFREATRPLPGTRWTKRDPT